MTTTAIPEGRRSHLLSLSPAQRVMFVAAAITVGLVAGLGVAYAGTPSAIFATPTFYTNYEHLAVTFVVGADNACQQDEFGGYSIEGCYDVDANNAPFDIHVYQTSPKWKAVYSDRSYGFNGQASEDLFWLSELHAPYCYGRSWSRSYKAVFRLFSPVNGRVLARDVETFGERCS